MNCEQMLGLLSTVNLDEEEEKKFGFETEKKMLKKVFSHNGYEAPDDFWKTLELDHFIQVFNDQGRLVYCSLNFFDTSSYSFLDLNLFEWFVLWDRPRLITELMHKYATDIFEGPYATKEVAIPKHIVREIFNAGNTSPFIPRAALSRFHHITPLRRPGGSRTLGFVVTGSAQLLAEGQEAMDISFV